MTFSAHRRTLAAAFTTLLVLLLFSACTEPPATPTKIRVGYLPMVSSLTYFVAVENKYFIDEEIQIEAMPIRTSNQIAKDLATGSIDAAIELSVVPLLQTIANGKIPFRIFSTSSITKENGFDAVIVRGDSKSTSLRDLSERRVGVFPGTTASATFKSVFERLFPAVPPPQFVPIDPSLHLQSLAKGEVEALHAYEPTVTIGLIEQDYRRLHTSIYAEQLSPNPIGVAAVSAKWYAANKGAGQALFRALDRAVHYIATIPEDARRILSVYTGASTSVTAAMHIMPMSTSDAIDRKGLGAYINILRGLGEISSPVSVSSIVINP